MATLGRTTRNLWNARWDVAILLQGYVEVKKAGALKKAPAGVAQTGDTVHYA